MPRSKVLPLLAVLTPGGSCRYDPAGGHKVRPRHRIPQDVRSPALLVPCINHAPLCLNLRPLCDRFVALGGNFLQGLSKHWLPRAANEFLARRVDDLVYVIQDKPDHRLQCCALHGLVEGRLERDGVVREQAGRWVFLLEVLRDSEGVLDRHASVHVVDDGEDPGGAPIGLFGRCNREFLVYTFNVNEFDPFYLERKALVVEAKSRAVVLNNEYSIWIEILTSLSTGSARKPSLEVRKQGRRV